jgi:hypothetical protein
MSGFWKSRLYIPPVNKPKAADGSVDYAEVIGNAVKKVLKLIPFEVVAVYTAAVYVASDVTNASLHIWLFRGAFVAGLIATPTYLYKAADRQKPYRTQMVLSTIAFAVWAYLTTGKQLVPQWYDRAGGFYAVLIYSLVAGCFPIKR